MGRSDNPVAIWDFTCPANLWELEELRSHLRSIAKKWVFQLERGGETGYMHYQGKVSLISKTRQFDIEDGDTSASHISDGKSLFNYVTKEASRVAGPWSDKDTPKFLQKKVEKMTTLYSWQRWLVGEAGIYLDRYIDLICDPEGCKGKSSIVSYCEYHDIAVKIPMMTGMNGKDCVQIVLQMYLEKGKGEKAYVIDFPRALRKDKLHEFYEAIETIKDGYLFDMRYGFTKRWMEVPRIFIFTNELPDESLLSRDRWRVWNIDEEKDIIKYKEEKKKKVFKGKD